LFELAILVNHFIFINAIAIHVMKAVMYDLKVLKAALKKIKLARKFAMVKYKNNWPKPKIEYQNQVIIKNHLGGICGSDIHQLKVESSYFQSILASKENPFPIGHETVGSVIEIGKDVQKLKNGDRVVFDPVATCAAYGFKLCSSCLKGRYAQCISITGIGDGSKLEDKYGGRDNFGGYGGGGFSELILGFEKQFFKVPDNVPDEVAVLTEPYAVSIHAVAQNLPIHNDNVIVIGAGIIGLFIIAAIRAFDSKCNIITLARYPQQAKWAKKLGSNEVIIEKDWKVLYEKIAELTEGRLFNPILSKKVIFGNDGPDIIFDCVASEKTIDDSLRLIRSNGRIVLVGFDFSITKKVDWSIAVNKEIEVMSSMIYGKDEYKGKKYHSFELALKFFEKNPDLFNGLITHRFPIEEYKKAYNITLNKGKNNALKVVFDFT
jgi:threonine dehydrogenase-like Zn-dependent dehydrogenase